MPYHSCSKQWAAGTVYRHIPLDAPHGKLVMLTKSWNLQHFRPLVDHAYTLMQVNVMQHCRDPCSLLCPSKTAGAFRTTATLYHRYSYYCWSGLLGKELYSALETFLFFLCCCCVDTDRGVLEETGWTATFSGLRAMSAGFFVGVLECVSSMHCVTAPSAHCVTSSFTQCVTVSFTHCVTASSTRCVTASSWHCSWGGIAAAAAGSSADCVAGGWVPILRALCARALLKVVLVLAMMLMPFSRVAGSLHRFFRTCSGTQCCCTYPEAV